MDISLSARYTISHYLDEQNQCHEEESAEAARFYSVLDEKFLGMTVEETLSANGAELQFQISHIFPKPSFTLPTSHLCDNENVVLTVDAYNQDVVNTLGANLKCNVYIDNKFATSGNFIAGSHSLSITLPRSVFPAASTSTQVIPIRIGIYNTINLGGDSWYEESFSDLQTVTILPRSPQINQLLVQHAYPNEENGYVAFKFGDNVQVGDAIQMRWSEGMVPYTKTTNNMHDGFTNTPTLSLDEVPFNVGSYTWLVSFLGQTCESTVSGEIKQLPPISLTQVSSTNVECRGGVTGTYAFKVGTTESWGGKIAVSYGTSNNAVQDTINLSTQLNKTYNVNNLTSGTYSVNAKYVPVIPR